MVSVEVVVPELTLGQSMDRLLLLKTPEVLAGIFLGRLRAHLLPYFQAVHVHPH